MKLTVEQRAAVEHEGNALLVACPGSGKTRALTAKLLRSLDAVRETPRRVACVTYTNTAVHEIENRLRLFGGPEDENYCSISTIHSFCLTNVLRHFYWKLPEYSNGFTVLPSDSERFVEIAREVANDFGLDFNRVRQSFELLNRNVDGTAIGLPDDAAQEFWRRLQQEHLIDFSSIVYFTYRLLKMPSISRAVACKYAFILIDEFQDTSELQVEILKLIAAHEVTQFFLVGDPHQSIFSFSGARPQLMAEFAKLIFARDDFQLLGNFRSSQPITQMAELLCARRPPMMAVGQHASFKEQPRYIHTPSVERMIYDSYLPLLEYHGIPLGEAAILAPTWYTLLPIGRTLRLRGIPVVGPGARPYKRSHLFARLAEQVCAYIEDPQPLLIFQVEREVANLVGEVLGREDFRVFSYQGRVTVFQLLSKAQALQAGCKDGVEWLRRAAEGFGEILWNNGFVPEIAKSLLLESVEEMLSDMRSNQIDLASLDTSDLGMFGSPKNSLKLMTMHSAKGREFDAVAIIDLHHGKIPHWSLKNVEESRRLLYVAMTRAKKLLILNSDEHGMNNGPCPFLNDLKLLS